MKFLFTKLVLSIILVSSKEVSMETMNFMVEGENQLVRYYLYTRRNPDKAVELNENNLDQLDVDNPVKIIVHGWLNNAEREWNEAMTVEYLKKDAYNVIQVDWSITAKASFFVAAASTTIVGDTLGNFIVTLHQKHRLPLTNFHLIGHSMGAHVVGNAGKKVFDLTGSKISRISALDPASPAFESEGSLTSEGFQKMITSAAFDNQTLISNDILEQIIAFPLFEKLQSTIYEGLKPTDAVIVDVIHTDACELGYKKPLGTVDFYPNGGAALQPGCRPCPTKPTMLDLINIRKILRCIFCSHEKSTTYFISSISTKKFISTKCNSWNAYKNGNCSNNLKVLMGEGYTHSPEVTGKFFLKTI